MFDVNTYDCLSLVIEILDVEFNKKTILIENRGSTTLEKQRMLVLGLEEHTTELKKPVEGCVVLMSFGTGRPRHCGIYFLDKSGMGNVIHLSKQSGTVVTCRISKLHKQGLTLTKFMHYEGLPDE